MEDLKIKITAELADAPFVSLFGPAVEEAWPLTMKTTQARAARTQAIHEFAEAHGWTAEIVHDGLRVTFRKKGTTPDERESESNKSVRSKNSAVA